MRRANGYGNIIKLSGNRRKPYAIRVVTGYKDDGNPIRKYISYHETLHLAQLNLTKYIEELNLSEFESGNIKFNELFNMFMEANSNTLSPKTLELYKSTYTTYCTALNNFAIKDITYMYLLKLVNNDKHYSTNKAIKTIIINLYKLAIIHGYKGNNIAREIRLKESEKAIIRMPFSEEEIITLFENINKVDNVDIVLLMIYTGLRSTELTNILIENINIEKRYLIGGGKTKAGTNRLIPISHKILDIIVNRINNRSEGYLIVENNKKITYSKLNNIFKTVMNKLNMEHLLHDTRHTFATLLSNANTDTSSIIKMMGHSSYDITEKVYTHKTIEDLLGAVDKLK